MTHAAHRFRSRPAVDARYDVPGVSLEPQVQNALNLALKLKNPAQMPALLHTIDENKQAVYGALTSLRYVHFARFLPSPDFSTLQVVTAYDGDLQSYLMDFVNVLGPIFNAILDFVQDAPRLPVERYPADFVDFVVRNNLPTGVWSAYPQHTVIDILRPSRVR